MKILILGGAGYIGTRLSNYLSEKNHKITVIDQFWFGDYLSPKVTKFTKRIQDLVSDDLRGFDCVLFLAGLANDPMAMFRPDLNFVENLSTPTFISYLCKEANVGRFICASSCSVYGYTDNQVLDESSFVSPKYPYGISKLTLEYGVMSMEDSKFRPILFRKGTVGGWSPKMRYDLVINTMLKSALTTGKIIVNNPDLWRPIIDIRDVIQGYERVINSDLRFTGVYNLSGENYTIGSLGGLVSNYMNSIGYKVDLIINHLADVRNYKVSTDKITKDFGFESIYNPVDSVKEILDNIDLNNYNFNLDVFSNIDTFKKILQNQ